MIYLNSVLDSTQQKASENMHLTELPKKSWAPYSEHVVLSMETEKIVVKLSSNVTIKAMLFWLFNAVCGGM